MLRGELVVTLLLPPWRFVLNAPGPLTTTFCPAHPWSLCPQRHRCSRQIVGQLPPPVLSTQIA